MQDSVTRLPQVTGMQCPRHPAALRWSTSIRNTQALLLMRRFLRRTFGHPLVALGSTVLWGVVELGALWRARVARHLTHATTER